MARPSEELPHVVIVGGGFGGLTAAQALAHANVRVTMVDQTNHHTFQPLLYQVATAGLSPADIAQPIRSIVHRQENTNVLMARATRIDLRSREVALDHGDHGDVLRYDFLILACGATTSYFGHDDWQATASGLKSIEDAISIRRRVLTAFELAEREHDPARRATLLSFVVIGGGPTGVELAGALAELSKTALHRDYRNAEASLVKVTLIEAGPRILPTFPPDLSESAVKQLRQLGVAVHVDAPATSIEPDCVRFNSECLKCSVVIWAAGVRANTLTNTLGVPLDKSGRVLVDADLSVPGFPQAFVIGDAANLAGSDGRPLPGVSPVAMQEARAVAGSIRRMIARQPATAFRYHDKGSMATIGRRRAIATVGALHMSGFIAWMAWLFVHVWYLVGLKNRLVVMISWAWSYLTFSRGARLITGTVPDPFLALPRRHEGVNAAEPEPRQVVVGPPAAAAHANAQRVSA